MRSPVAHPTCSHRSELLNKGAFGPRTSHFPRSGSPVVLTTIAGPGFSTFHTPPPREVPGRQCCPAGGIGCKQYAYQTVGGSFPSKIILGSLRGGNERKGINRLEFTSVQTDPPVSSPPKATGARRSITLIGPSSRSTPVQRAGGFAGSHRANKNLAGVVCVEPSTRPDAPGQPASEAICQIIATGPILAAPSHGCPCRSQILPFPLLTCFHGDA